jgi:UDP-hydrolysing UDP-N-acetyl-D-glucosamine 2-epimerase
VRRICVITGSRAEYGLLRGLIREIDRRSDLDLRLLVTGSHLDDAFGATVGDIEADGWPIAAAVRLEPGTDDGLAIARAVASGVRGIAEALAEIQPDIVVVLGDRYEILAAAQAAMLLGLPIAHISGGESTEGAIDESIRHAITKMAHLHFVSAEPYRHRVIQLGEEPDRVFTVGTMSLDGIAAAEPIQIDALVAELDLPAVSDGLVLATYHPVTVDQGESASGLQAMIAALERHTALTVVITGANADAGGGAMNEQLRALASAHAGRMRFIMSLGSTRYLSLLRHADAVIGNSSSGIVEAAVVGTPSVNIGSRQAGRLRSASVIDCAPEADAVHEALARALSPEFQDSVRASTPLFGSSPPSPLIAETLARYPLDGIRMKRFWDIV